MEGNNSVSDAFTMSDDYSSFGGDSIIAFNKGDYRDFDMNSLSSSHRRRLYDDVIQVDKGRHKIARKVNGINTKIVFYETNMTPGNMIRNAISGIRYSEYRVGSSAEDMFYTVCYSIGDTGKRDPCILFFDSPSEYEKHFHTKISDSEVKRWHAKMIKEKERSQ